MEGYNTDYSWTNPDTLPLFQQWLDFGEASKLKVESAMYDLDSGLDEPYALSDPSSLTAHGVCTCSMHTTLEMIAVNTPESSQQTTQKNSPAQDKRERRREQNRYAQRVYRDKREKHTMELQTKLAELQKKHDTLSQSYTEQKEYIRQMTVFLEQLQRQRDGLQLDTASTEGVTKLALSRESFDLYSIALPRGYIATGQ